MAASVSPIVQYVVLRSDLQTVLKWPVGALIAQACHACTAVFALHKDDPHVIAYVEDLDNMRKVVLQVGCLPHSKLKAVVIAIWPVFDYWLLNSYLRKQKFPTSSMKKANKK